MAADVSVAGEPRWIALDTVIAINRDITRAAGERHEVRDLASLRKAVAHPWNKWVYFMDADLAVLAATLLASVGTAGGFAAANKRTAYRATTSFLETNGQRLELGVHASHALEQPRQFFAGKLSQAGLVEWFRLWMEPAA